MKLFVSLLVLGCIVSPAHGQWIVTTIQFTDSASALDSICAVRFQSSNNTMYVGGLGKLVAIDAETHRKLAVIAPRGPLNVMCTSPANNELYCASYGGESLWVVNCATNHAFKKILDARVGAMCYAQASGKLYISCPAESLVEVLDCASNNVVAKIALHQWLSALCYNPELNRVYVAKSLTDEVAVIDCSADTVISTIWVRGVEPAAICYDSATECVYTLNHTSGSLTVIDCGGDSVLRAVPVGAHPERLVVGPEGKAYCGGFSDSVVAVVESSGTRTIPVGQHLTSMSFDPLNNEVCCAASDSEAVLVDAIGDTVVARVAAGRDLRFVCYDPVDTSMWLAGARVATMGVISGASGRLSDMLLLGLFVPGALSYVPTVNELYCLGNYKNDTTGRLVIVDGNTNRVTNVLRVGSAIDSMLWNPVNNKLYIASSKESSVRILDCAGDSIVATVQTGKSPQALCCSDGGEVYVTRTGGVDVIGPDRDSIRTVVPTPCDPTSLSYDRTDNKVYASLERHGLISVIDAAVDTVVATVPVPETCGRVCWNQNHNKVYVCANLVGLAVIDCSADTVMRNLGHEHPPEYGVQRLGQRQGLHERRQGLVHHRRGDRFCPQRYGDLLPVRLPRQRKARRCQSRVLYQLLHARALWVVCNQRHG